MAHSDGAASNHVPRERDQDGGVRIACKGVGEIGIYDICN